MYRRSDWQNFFDKNNIICICLKSEINQIIQTKIYINLLQLIYVTLKILKAHLAPVISINLLCCCCYCLCVWLLQPHETAPTGFSVHGISQTGILVGCHSLLQGYLTWELNPVSCISRWIPLPLSHQGRPLVTHTSVKSIIIGHR